MKFSVHENVIAMFPNLTIGVLVGVIEKEKDDISKVIGQLKENSLSHLLSKNIDTAKLMEIPNISGWRETYKKFGAKPKKHKPTHEAMVRRIIKESKWPHTINNIVDIYLTNEIEHILPHGGYDLNQINGDLDLEVSTGGEDFVDLKGELEKTEDGEIVYKDKQRVLTRRWNYKDCKETMITEKTKSFILMVEAASEKIDFLTVNDSISSLKDKFENCYHGNFKITTLVVNEKNNSFVL